VGEEGGASIEHPLEIDAFIDARGEGANFGVGVEILAGGEDAAEQEGGIDAGEFAFPGALSGSGVEEVEEPAVVILDGGIEGAERGADAGGGIAGGDPFAFGGDAEAGEGEAGGGDAGDVGGARFAGAVGAGAVDGESGGGVGMFPEEAEAAAAEVVQEIIAGGEGEEESAASQRATSMRARAWGGRASSMTPPGMGRVSAGGSWAVFWSCRI
jgi:hypothetical protein